MHAHRDVSLALAEARRRLAATGDGDPPGRRRRLEEDVAALAAGAHQALSPAAAELLASVVGPRLARRAGGVDPAVLALFAPPVGPDGEGPPLGPVPADLVDWLGLHATAAPCLARLLRTGPRGVRAAWLALHRRGVPPPLRDLVVAAWLPPGLPLVVPCAVSCAFATPDEREARAPVERVVGRWLLWLACVEHEAPPLPVCLGLARPADNAAWDASALIAAGRLRMAARTTAPALPPFCRPSPAPRMPHTTKRLAGVLAETTYNPADPRRRPPSGMACPLVFISAAPVLITLEEYTLRFASAVHAEWEAPLTVVAAALYLRATARGAWRQATHRLFAAAFLVASKLVTDYGRLPTSAFARLAGVSPTEMNRLELAFLVLLRFDVSITPECFGRVARRLGLGM